MNLDKLISIAGKPGLYKLLSQSKGGFIVEDLIHQKKTLISIQNQVNVLENIAIYTHNEDVPLGDIFTKMYAFTNGKETISHKSSEKDLRAKMKEIIEDYDEERVYTSDLKKLFNWFNLLVKSNYFKNENTKKENSEEE